jgi:hypothetical protein
MDRVVVEIREPGREPRRITMTTSVEVGRDCSGVIISDSSASRRHVALTPHPEGLTATDLGSRNGTLVNGVRIKGPANVGPGDVVQVGETRLAVVERTAPPPSSAKAPPIAATALLDMKASGATQRLPPVTGRQADGGATVRSFALPGAGLPLPTPGAAMHDVDAWMQAGYAWAAREVPGIDLATFERAVLDVGLEHLADVLARLRHT